MSFLFKENKDFGLLPPAFLVFVWFFLINFEDHERITFLYFPIIGKLMFGQQAILKKIKRAQTNRFYFRLFYF